MKSAARRAVAADAAAVSASLARARDNLNDSSTGGADGTYTADGAYTHPALASAHPGSALAAAQASQSAWRALAHSLHVDALLHNNNNNNNNTTSAGASTSAPISAVTTEAETAALLSPLFQLSFAHSVQSSVARHFVHRLACSLQVLEGALPSGDNVAGDNNSGARNITSTADDDAADDASAAPRNVLSLSPPPLASPLAPRRLLLCGGVASNGYLREYVSRAAAHWGFVTAAAPRALCTDNGVMIAWAAAAHARAEVASGREQSVDREQQSDCVRESEMTRALWRLSAIPRNSPLYAHNNKAPQSQTPSQSQMELLQSLPAALRPRPRWPLGAAVCVPPPAVSRKHALRAAAAAVSGSTITGASLGASTGTSTGAHTGAGVAVSSSHGVSSNLLFSSSAAVLASLSPTSAWFGAHDAGDESIPVGNHAYGNGRRSYNNSNDNTTRSYNNKHNNSRPNASARSFNNKNSDLTNATGDKLYNSTQNQPRLQPQQQQQPQSRSQSHSQSHPAESTAITPQDGAVSSATATATAAPAARGRPASAASPAYRVTTLPGSGVLAASWSVWWGGDAVRCADTLRQGWLKAGALVAAADSAAGAEARLRARAAAKDAARAARAAARARAQAEAAALAMIARYDRPEQVQAQAQTPAQRSDDAAATTRHAAPASDADADADAEEEGDGDVTGTADLVASGVFGAGAGASGAERVAQWRREAVAAVAGCAPAMRRLRSAAATPASLYAPSHPSTGAGTDAGDAVWPQLSRAAALASLVCGAGRWVPAAGAGLAMPVTHCEPFPPTSSCVGSINSHADGANTDTVAAVANARQTEPRVAPHWDAWERAQRLQQWAPLLAAAFAPRSLKDMLRAARKAKRDVLKLTSKQHKAALALARREKAIAASAATAEATATAKETKDKGKGRGKGKTKGSANE